jgi:hypothetical protein
MGQSVRPVLVATEAQLGFRDLTSVLGAQADGAQVCDTGTSEFLLNAVRGLWHEGMGCCRWGISKHHRRNFGHVMTRFDLTPCNAHS